METVPYVAGMAGPQYTEMNKLKQKTDNPEESHGVHKVSLTSTLLWNS